MSGTPVISVTGLTKAYRIWTTPAQRLISPAYAALARWLPGAFGAALDRRARTGYQDFFALQGVDFEVNKGEAVGIIGRNGAGKSTLLQILSGTLQPTAGNVHIAGRVAALLELGAGFNPEFTGRENVYLNGAVLGFSRTQIDARFNDIAAFADIGDFIDQPVKTYSSGMLVRLAFAVQTAVEPEILIVDEALSVGDFFFQQKCFKRIAELRTRGTTLLFVSHDMGSVRDLCERTLYLKQGQTVLFGDTQAAIAAYYAEDRATPSAPPPAAISPAPAKHAVTTTASDFRARALWWADQPAENGAKPPARLLGLAVLDEAGQPATRAKTGERIRLQVLFRGDQPGRYHAAIELKNRYDQVVTSLSSYTCGLAAQPLNAGETSVLELEIQLNFEAGRYSCQAVVAHESPQANRAARLDASPWVGPLEIVWDYENERAPFLGMFGPKAEARFLT